MTGGVDLHLTSSHFTEVFVEQLAEAISTIPSHHAGGVDVEALQGILRSRIGIARGAGSAVVRCLTDLRLVSDSNGVVGRSPYGDRVRRALRLNESRELALVVIRSGFMADQIRSLRPHLDQVGEGYVCGRSAARAAAPQLLGLLARLPDVLVAGHITIGHDSGLELDSVWNESTPESRINWSDIEKRRKAIGERAELYSIQFERSSRVGAREKINWVSRDDDSLGYDIEVLDKPIRRIEVKGSAGQGIQFLLSSNEYRVASRYSLTYEIQYWGGIELARDPADDYERLVKTGYPIRVQDPVATLANPPWTIEPYQFRVTRPISAIGSGDV